MSDEYPPPRWEDRGLAGLPVESPVEQGTAHADVVFGPESVVSDPSLDPSAVTGPPWPRLVAADSAYRPPRLVRWPIISAVIILVSYVVTLTVLRPTTSSGPTEEPPVMFTASDANFTATFPGTPTRTNATGGTLFFESLLSNHAVVVYATPLPTPLPPSDSASLDDIISQLVTAAPGGAVLSHTPLTYRGQPAEDVVSTYTGGVGHWRAVIFGETLYTLAGLADKPSSFDTDYTRLLDTFEPTGAPALAAKLVAAPAGYAMSMTADPPNGPVDSAALDTQLGEPGISAAAQFVTGYRIEYDSNSNNDNVVIDLLQFASPSDAASFATSLTPSGTEKTGHDPDIPGSQTIDSTTAESNGAYQHLVLASNGDTVLFLQSASLGKAKPAWLEGMARQQYARL